MKKIITLLLLLSSKAICIAQFQLGGIEYANFAKSNISNSEANQEVSFQEIGCFVNLPKQLKNKKTTIVNGLQYGLTTSTVYNSPLFEKTKASKQLHSLSYALTVVQKWNAKWTFLARLIPTIASDFEDDLGSEDFLFLGSAMANYKIGEHMILGGGIAYTTRSGKALLLPVLTFKYKHDRHHFDVLLPSRLQYLYTIGTGEKINLGAKVALNGGNFNVRVNTFADGIDPASINKIIYSRINLGPLATIRIQESIMLNLFGGYSVGRSYKFDDGDEEYAYDSENGPFISLGLSFVPKGKAKEEPTKSE